ncbi:unnamed protein product [Hymenolepis diminuta]|uniref:NF-kappa-B inhibitor-like protein 1 n=1 Tax=Hymenolepis diminuta TaxID=6216 RepID=A0A3P6ZK36_HYMDI|nr:unnamed protein product [Hymenolepis diminuta]
MFVSAFDDPGTSSGDFFEEIRKQYERRRREQTRSRFTEEVSRPSTSAGASAAEAARKADEFRRKHAEGLRKRGIAFSLPVNHTTSPSYEQYSKQWHTFLQSGESRAIPWPPIKVGDKDDLMRFVGENMIHLRQLQVDWHPDRFFARLPSSIQRTDSMRERVTALSQFFNNAVIEFREKNKKVRLE